MHTVFDLISGQFLLAPKKYIYLFFSIFFSIRPNKRTLNVRARVAIRPVYSKIVLPSRKSLEIIINIKKKKKFIIITKLGQNGGCPLIRACSLIRSNTVLSYKLSNLHRSLANVQLCPRVLLSVLYLKNMPLSKPSIPCVILKTWCACLRLRKCVLHDYNSNNCTHSGNVCCYTYMVNNDYDKFRLFSPSLYDFISASNLHIIICMEEPTYF